MARGLIVIQAVKKLNTNEYQLTLTEINNNIAVGDHIGARTSTGNGAIYLVDNITTNEVVVNDSLIEAETGPFGSPTIGSGGFGTPEEKFDLGQLPFDSPGWDAMVRRNSKLVDSKLLDPSTITDLETVVNSNTRLLATPIVVDGKTASSTVLVPGEGSLFIVTRIVIIRTDVNGSFSNVETVSVGVLGDFELDNIVPETALTGTEALNSVYQFALNERSIMVSHDLMFEIDVPATGPSIAELTVLAYGFVLTGTLATPIPGVVSGGGGISRPVDRTNEESTTLALGTIVAQDVTVAKGLRRANPASDDNLSRPVGIVTNADGILPSEIGEVATVEGDEAEVAMEAGLSPTNGEEVILSTTAGLGTLPGSGIAEPTSSGNAVQRIGIIINASAYGSTQRVLLQYGGTGHRRLV